MSPDDNLYRELDRLKKSDLLELLITKKVPESVRISDNVRKILENTES